VSRSAARADEPFVSNKISPSRVNAYVTCGVAFRMKYVERLPEQRSGSAALFGSVIHEAMEHWTPNREQDLLGLVRNAWLTCTEGTVVKDFLAEYQSLSVAAIKQEHAIREAWAAKGKESKAPRMTKEWKESDVGQAIRKLMPRWERRLNDGSPWLFSEYDPLPALYDESLVLARRIQSRLGSLPNSLYTEFAVDVEWRGFRLTGYVDVVEPLVDFETGELKAIGVLDYKTYKKGPIAELEGDAEGEGAELKDYRQLVLYDVAIRDLVARGALALPLDEVPLLVGVDYLRAQERRFWQMTEADHDRLEAELKMYRSGVEAGVFLPAQKGQNPDFCDYPENCCLRNTSAAGGCAQRVAAPC
jgi:CRISPR/Cas system-associated exonuclease Cas4 (RecB family)